MVRLLPYWHARSAHPSTLAALWRRCGLICCRTFPGFRPGEPDKNGVLKRMNSAVIQRPLSRKKRGLCLPEPCCLMQNRFVGSTKRDAANRKFLFVVSTLRLIASFAWTPGRPIPAPFCDASRRHRAFPARRLCHPQRCPRLTLPSLPWAGER